MKIISTSVSSVLAASLCREQDELDPADTDAALISTGGFRKRRIANGPGWRFD